MNIRSFTHKGLKRLYEDNVTKGVPPESVDKLRKMLGFLDSMQDAGELRPPGVEGSSVDRWPRGDMELERDA